MTEAAAAKRVVVAVALSRGATILVREADLAPDERDELAGLLDHLVRQGVVACFSFQPLDGRLGREGVLEALLPHVGRHVIEATLAAGAPPPEPRPAFLCSVWPFEGGQCRLTATGQFLGLDLDLVASPSGDEEVGFRLPAYAGPFVLHAGPVGRPT